MDDFEMGEMSRIRPISESAIYTLCNWLMNFIPKAIAQLVGGKEKNLNSFQFIYES